MNVRALTASAAFALAVAAVPAVALPPVTAGLHAAGSGDPASLNVQAIVDRINMNILTS
ncbi:hypothetical protein [Nonomuraea lactucae]|uniref:hypothetical protein n=1 Tax=Nonomuraea lactucae TaxID=2249762 RepID=UPI0013B411F6|nr:hypothetical protein [Nonomuraea lactucae]